MVAPLFLLAPPRSFTSVINAMLGQHPQMYGLPELQLFSFDHLIELWHPDVENFFFGAKLRHGLLRSIAEIYMGEQTDETIEFAEHWCAKRQYHHTWDVFLELKEKLDPLIPVDKSPKYTVDYHSMKRILKCSPDARFIHLIRHPVKQCESTVALSDSMFPIFVNSIEYLEDEAIVEPQIAWHDINVTITNFLHENVQPSQYLVMRGEEIMEFPRERLASICQWLNIRDDNEAVDAMMRPEESPFACFGPVTALYGNDPNFLRAPAFRQHKPKTPSLYDPVSWRQDKDGISLYPEVVELANLYGYE